MTAVPATFGVSDIWNWLAGILATWLVNTASPNTKSMFALGITVGLPLLTVISRFVTTVSTSVTWTGKTIAMPSVAGFGVKREMTGWSFMDCTLIGTSTLALAPSERDTIRVNLFVPNWLAPGVTVATMFGVLLVLKVTLPAGSRAGSSVEKDKVKLAGSVPTSGSPIVKFTVPGWSSCRLSA